MGERISRRDLLFNKAPQIVLGLIATACAVPDTVPIPTPEAKSTPTRTPQEIVKASLYGAGNKAQRKETFERNLGKRITFAIDRQNWIAKDSSKLPLPGHEGFVFIDLVPPLDTQAKFTMLATKGQREEWQITNWNLPRDIKPNGDRVLPVDTNFECSVVDFDFEAVPKLISVNGMRF